MLKFPEGPDPTLQWPNLNNDINFDITFLMS